LLGTLLNMTTGRIDPFGQARNAVRSLLQAQSRECQRDALHSALGLLSRRRVLPPRCREELEVAAGSRPDVLIVLAEEDFLRARIDSAIQRLHGLPESLLRQPQWHWLAEIAREAFSPRAAGQPDMESLLGAVRAASWVAAFAINNDDRPEALRDLLSALGASPQGLPECCRGKLSELAGERPEAHLVLAEEAFLRGDTGQALHDLSVMSEVLLSEPRHRWVAEPLAAAFAARASLCGGLVAPLQTAAVAQCLAAFVDEPRDRSRALQALLQELRQAAPLPEPCRGELRQLSEARLEASLVLAQDDLLRGEPLKGFLLLTRVLWDVAADVSWLSEAAVALWDQYCSRAEPSVLEALWQHCQDGDEGGQVAAAALAIAALDRDLSPPLLAALEQRQEASPNAALAWDCHAVREGRVAAALPRLLERLPELPEAVVQWQLLPRLAEAAAVSGVGQRQWFHRQDDRPQLLEIFQAPLTSIYGGRIACWTFVDSAADELDLAGPTDGTGDLPSLLADLLRRMAARPVRFVVTGHGPSAVCARVSAILNDLANERACPSDLVLAGFSSFDLTAEPPSAASRIQWDEESLARRMTELAARLGVEDVLHNQDLSPLLARFAGAQHARTFEAATQALQQVESEMGFLVNTNVDATAHRGVSQALDENRSPPTEQPFPVLLEYQHHGQPLTVRLPRLCLGLDEYERMVREYGRSVREEIRREWERRRRTYEEWSRQFVSSFHRLRLALAEDGQAALGRRIMYVHYAIDPDTATQRRYDPPKPATESEYLMGLPRQIADQLAYWAWATYRIELLEQEPEVNAGWLTACLVDAFLRGWPVPTNDERVDQARQEWQQKWRPVALLALDSALRTRGLSLDSVAVENTVFRVVGEDDDFLSLSILHVWDPHHDAPPDLSGGTTLFTPAFGQRQRSLIPARQAQERSVCGMRQVLAGGPITVEGLFHTLACDSGEAVDLLIERLCETFVREGLSAEVDRVQEEAARRVDSVVAFGLRQEFESRTTVRSLLTLAKDCGKEGRETGALPDFLAWELYLVGLVTQHVAKSYAEHSMDWHPGGAGWRQPALSGEVAPVAELTPWQIVRAIVDRTPLSGAASSALELASDLSYGGPQVLESWSLLHGQTPEYARCCLKTDGQPPASPRRKSQFAPGCFEGWNRVCYEVAQGDAAVALAWAIRLGAHHVDRTALDELETTLESLQVPPCFEEIELRRNALLEGLRKYHGRRDRVTLDLAAGTVQHALTEIMDVAESAYSRAAQHDPEHGVGWMRLARLKWLTAHYREALALLVGPPPRADLQACQLPLALAVRRAGGGLSVTSTPSGAWKGPAAATLVVERSEQGLVLVCENRRGEQRKRRKGRRSPPPPKSIEAGRCVVAGLSETDCALLEEFFLKYQPDMLQSPETTSFERWICLVTVPSLGCRAALAERLQGDAELGLLAAAYYLGAPAALAAPPGAAPQPRPAEWLSADVVSALQWGVGPSAPVAAAWV